MRPFLVHEAKPVSEISIWREIRAYLGIERNTTRHSEKLLSALGAFAGILAVYGFSHWYLEDVGALLMLASMGASAVLLFAVPHGALSQRRHRWPLGLGRRRGHLPETVPRQPLDASVGRGPGSRGHALSALHSPAGPPPSWPSLAGPVYIQPVTIT